MRRVLSILSVALVTAGAVILSDAATTLAWKEPVSAAYSALRQSDASNQFDRLANSFREEVVPDAETDRPTGPRRAVRRLASKFSGGLSDLDGEGIARIEIPKIDLDYAMVEGTSPDTLRKGPGRYPSTGLPGSGRTIGIAGHRTTYGAPFRRINELKSGDAVEIEMPYGTMTYRVAETKIVEPTRVGIVRDIGRERIVMTACHPLYSAAKRIAVFAELDSVEPLDRSSKS